MSWSKVNIGHKPLGWWYHKIMCELKYHLADMDGYNHHLNTMLKKYKLNLYGQPLTPLGGLQSGKQNLTNKMGKTKELLNIDNINEKTLTNTTASQAKDNVPDITFWGNGDTFKLISKASSKNEAWMKSTKAMQIDHIGCVVQVTTQQGTNISEALTFVPGVKIHEEIDEAGTVTSRRLVASR